jgi:hypothetical protein
VDAPAHFVDGATPIDKVSLYSLVGPALVADLTHVTGDITVADLRRPGWPGRSASCSRRPTRPARSSRPSARRAGSGCPRRPRRWLIADGVELVGIDYLTIESHTRTDTWDAHHALLGAACSSWRTPTWTRCRPARTSWSACREAGRRRRLVRPGHPDQRDEPEPAGRPRRAAPAAIEAGRAAVVARAATRSTPPSPPRPR